jgi:hypothetical protein
LVQKKHRHLRGHPRKDLQSKVVGNEPVQAPLPATVERRGTERLLNLANGRSVIIRINDRGSFVSGRIVDVSYSAAATLGMTERSIAKVKLEVVQ